MWFPIPSAIVRALHRFELSISQLNVSALENWLGVVISSYELGMDLSPGDFEGFWTNRPMKTEGLYSIKVRNELDNPRDYFEP